MIENETLKQLVHQIRLHSDKLVSDMEAVAAELKAEPQHLSEFSKYARMVMHLPHSSYSRCD